MASRLREKLLCDSGELARPFSYSLELQCSVGQESRNELLS